MDVGNPSDIILENETAMVLATRSAPNFNINAMRQRIVQLKGILGAARKNQYADFLHGASIRSASARRNWLFVAIVVYIRARRSSALISLMTACTSSGPYR